MPASDVTVKAVFAEHTYSGWTQNDDDTHTRACTACGVKQTEACTGGEATCTKEAVCEVCGQSYGEKDSDNHTGEPVWKQDADSHTQYYDCCGVVTVGQEPHEWEDGKCAECGYGCTHSGGTATCTARAVCELCGQPYGEKAPDKHTGQEAWVTTAESHTKVYSCCKAVIQQSAAHTGMMKAAALSAATDVPTAVGQQPVHSRLCVRSAARCTVIRIPAIIRRQKYGHRRTANITISALTAVKRTLTRKLVPEGRLPVLRKQSARYAASPMGIWTRITISI